MSADESGMMASWSQVVESLGVLGFKLRYRIKLVGVLEPELWSGWQIVASNGYLETGASGPVVMGMVEWIDIDPFETVAEGRLIPSRCLHRIDAVLQALRTCCIRTENFSGLVRARVES